MNVHINGNSSKAVNKIPTSFNSIETYIRQSVISGNGGESQSSGSVISTDGIIMIDSTLFDNNNSTNPSNINLGSTISFRSGQMTLVNSSFISNIGNNGAALQNINGHVLMSSCTFTSNKSTLLGSAGGAIYNQGSLRIFTSVFTSNQAHTSGGAIYSVGELAELFVESSQFNSNDSGKGGAIAAQSGRIMSTKFYTNTADSGAAIYNSNFGNDINTLDPTLTIENSIFDENSGIIAGSLFTYSDYLIVKNSTFKNSSLATPEISIYNEYTGAELPNKIVTVHNSLFVGKSNGNYCNGFEISSLGGNYIETSAPGTCTLTSNSPSDALKLVQYLGMYKFNNILYPSIESAAINGGVDNDANGNRVCASGDITLLVRSQGICDSGAVEVRLPVFKVSSAKYNPYLEGVDYLANLEYGTFRARIELIASNGQVIYTDYHMPYFYPGPNSSGLVLPSTISSGNYALKINLFNTAGALISSSTSSNFNIPPKPTATSTPTLTPTRIPTLLPTNTPIPTFTPTNTPMPTFTPTAEPTNIPTPTLTPTLEPTSIPSPTATNVPTPTITPTLEPTHIPSPTSTPTPTPYREPDFPKCEAGSIKVGEYSGTLWYDGVNPVTKSTRNRYNFPLLSPSKLSIEGYIMEGHPEVGCPSNILCDQGQVNEELRVRFSNPYRSEVVLETDDQGANVNEWIKINKILTKGEFSGDSVFTVEHRLQPKGQGSLSYKFTVCATK